MFSPASRARSRNAQQRLSDSPTSGLVSGGSPASQTPTTPGIIKHSPLAFRMAPVLKSGDRAAADGSDPVFVCDFPQQLRTLLAEAPPSHRSEYRGGMDGESGLSWVMFLNKIFVWSHLNTQASSGCKVLTLPPQLCTGDGQSVDPKHGKNWLVRIITSEEINPVNKLSSASLLLCSQRSFVVAYWPDIYKEKEHPPVFCSAPEEKLLHGARRTSSSEAKVVTSLIASRTRNLDSVAIASFSSGLCRLDLNQSGISQQFVAREGITSGEQAFDPFDFNTSDAPRSLAWFSPKSGSHEFLLLNSRGVECWEVELFRGGKLSLAWSFDISEDSEVRKDLTGQKQVWLLDLKLTPERNLVILAASLSKDRVTSSSFMQYSLLTFLYSPPSSGEGSEAKFLKRKAPAQVILPKARVEQEEFLYSMQLRVGGKPGGSAMILAADGTATISHYLHGVGRLYQFDLAWDAGRVLDASVVPSDDDEGAWVLLTEKAGVWAVPERAVLLGAVEPPERSLSRKGSLNDEQRLLRSENKVETRGVVFTQRPVQDEEAEATIGRLFQSFVATRQVAGVLEKLQKSGAFEQDGEMSVFSRFSRSIVDTIAKHWTSGGGAGAAVTVSISAQLAEKQKRHQQYLNFLAASRCHELLRHQRRSSLQAILEHGEKLAAILQMKEAYNSRAAQSNEDGNTGALWEALELVGEAARRKNVMLMDKEKAEVFFTRVSELEEFFGCIDEHSKAIIWKGHSTKSLAERLFEVSEACVGSIRAARRYRESEQTWYPSPEGLASPWFCQPVVRSGLWRVACHLMELQSELDMVSREKLMVSLGEVAEALLDGYYGAIAARVERGEEFRGLQSEYWSRRDGVLAVLQQYGKEAAEFAAQNAGGEATAEEKRFEALRARYGDLLALARRHAGYQTLWEICIELNDMDCLRKLMHESMGLKEGRFSTFVFEQFLKKGQHAKLLRLGEEFNEDLVSFLQGRRSLSWLHDFYVKRFEVASDTMHSLALSGDRLPVSITRDHKPGNALTLAARRKLLYLAKLSALTGRRPGAVDKSIQIDADLGILSVQELACELGLATSAEVLPPLQLVEVCLGSEHKELVLRSLEVFALSGDVFRRGNKSLLESAWLKVADQDDWVKMRKMSEEENWSDEEQFDALRATALFSAGKYCFGGTPFIVGMPFSDVLPALSDESNRRGVDQVLAEHRDFPEAGEAMVMAVRLGGGLELLGDDSMDI